MKYLLLCLVVVVVVLGAKAQGNSTCGGIGELCCYNNSRAFCHSGSCLVRPGDIGGVCTIFGGVYVGQNDVCVSPNFFGNLNTFGPLTCGCNDGFNASCVDFVQPTGPSQFCTCIASNARESLANAPDNTFGGVYVSTAGSGQPESCAVPNPLTNDCTCPSGYTAQTITAANSETNVTFGFCGRTVAGMGVAYGGVYLRTADNSSCIVPNGAFGCGCAGVLPPTATNAEVHASCPYEIDAGIPGRAVVLGVCHVVSDNPTASFAFTPQLLSGALHLLSETLLPAFPISLGDTSFAGSQDINNAFLSGTANYNVSHITIQQARLSTVTSTFSNDSVVHVEALLDNIVVLSKFSLNFNGAVTTWDMTILGSVLVELQMDAPLNFIGGRLAPGFVLTGLTATLQNPTVSLTNANGPLGLLGSAIQGIVAGQLQGILNSQVARLSSFVSSALAMANQLASSVVPIVQLHDTQGQPLVLVDMSFAGCKAVVNTNGAYFPLAGDVFAKTPAQLEKTTIPSLSQMLLEGPAAPHTAALALTQDMMTQLGHAAAELITDGLVLPLLPSLGANVTSLTVADLESVIPGISTAFPASTPAQIRLSFASDPVFNITSNGISFSVTMNVYFDALPASAPSSHDVPCSTVNGQLRCTAASMLLTANHMGVVFRVDNSTGDSITLHIAFTPDPQIIVTNTSSNVGPKPDAAQLQHIASDAVDAAVSRGNQIIAQTDLTFPKTLDNIHIDNLDVLFIPNNSVILQLDVSAL